jgi:serine/threonine-protein kinase
VGAVSLAVDSSPPGDLYCPACEQTFHAGERCPADGEKLVRLEAQLDPLLGRELDGQYTILEKLGQGAMGAVYRAAQHSVSREVAVKVVSPHRVSEPAVIKRFLREAKLASRLGHPNAVTVIDFGQTDDGVFYLVMELVLGRTLDQVIDAEGVFAPERVVRIGAQVCDALEAAHALQIVHRDLKPSNIMLLSSGRDLVKVLDFGLAKSVAADQASTTMTSAGELVGTPAFMPPELALGQPCDGRGDLYSLGVVLYLLGSGRLPFQSQSPHELVAMHGTEPAPPMQGVPPALGRVIDRLLAKDPADRYQTAAAVRAALDASLHATPAIGAIDAPAGGPHPAVTSPSLAPARRSRALPIALGLIGAAAVAGLLFALWSGSKRDQRPPPPPPLEATEPAAKPPAPTPPPAPPPTPPGGEPADLVAPEPPRPPRTEPKRAGKPPRTRKARPPKRPEVAPPKRPEAPPPPKQGSASTGPVLPF